MGRSIPLPIIRLLAAANSILSPAFVPMAILFEPVNVSPTVVLYMGALPIATFELPVVFERPAFIPKKLFLMPFLLFVPASLPKKLLSLPDILFTPAPAPKKLFALPVVLFTPA